MVVDYQSMSSVKFAIPDFNRDECEIAESLIDPDW